MAEAKAYIIATGSYLPKNILTNKDLEKKVDTSNEWIVSRTGIQERRIADSSETTSQMGALAAEKAFQKTGLSKDEIDLVLVATLSPDYSFPSTACIIQNQLNINHAGACDIQAACSGFIYVLSMAKAYIESGLYKNILVVASEKLSSIIDYEDRNTCVLFGDGAFACIVSHKGPGLRLGEFSLGSDGNEAKLLVLPAGGSALPASSETVAGKMHYLRMDGKEIFKHAVRRMETAAQMCLEKANLQAKDIAYFVPHQANMRIIDALTKRFEIPEERVVKTIHLYGNTSASSIGITLDHLLEQKKLKDKDNLLFVAFGAGLTWGAMIVTGEGINE